MLEGSAGTRDAPFRSGAEIMAVEKDHTSGVYPKRPLALVRGEGGSVWDSEGRRYLDLTGGQGAALIGHANPAVVRAIQNQAQELISCPEIFYNDRRAELYTALSAITPAGLDRFFLCNSGAEAIEAALKLARWRTGRVEILAAKGGFHGRPLGALTTTWKKTYRQPFEPLLPGVNHIPFNDLESAEEAISRSTAAVLLEVVQGEGGVIAADTDYLLGVRDLCEQAGALFILDEIQTGLGRTGSWFACDLHNLSPDVLCIGKGLGGGMPIAAVAWQSSLGTMPRGSHGSTFGGNPLACAAAIATLGVIDDKLIDQTALRGKRFMDLMTSLNHSLIREVRGAGLMIGIDLRRRVTPILKALMKKGVLALPAGPTVLRILPPLTISDSELEEAGNCIIETIEALNHGFS